MLRLRPLAVLLSLALALCLLGLWRARSQTAAPRRVTNTSNEGLNLNPSLSGNGRRIAFESTEDVAGAGGGAFFRAIRADISRTPAAFVQLAGARAPASGISQDGSVIAFAAKDDPLGTNPDGNSEIFLHNGTSLRQVTNTTPNDISRRATDGNFQPSLSDDGRFIAFSSNRNLTSQNSDGNFEIFVYDATANSFSQLTNTAGGYGSTVAKLSGDGSRVAYIKDSSTLPAVQRDLILQDRTGGVTRLAADNVTNLALTYGRAISDDGARVVFTGDTAADSSQVFLYDARTNSARAVTSLDARVTEVPLHPTISGDGTRIAFATRRTVPQLGGNGDHGVELYTLDIPTGQFAVVTDAPSQADCYQGSTRVCEVVSSLSDDGSLVAFNFPRALSGEVETGLENNSEIYVSGTAARPTTGTLEVVNGASFGHEPSTDDAVAPESYAVATGGALAFDTVQAEKQSDGTYPTTLAGTTVTVQGRRAQLVFVSPARVDFLVPADTPLGDATVVVTNEEGFRSIGTVEVLSGAPGIFTKSGDGTGEGEVVNAQTRAAGPFDPTGGELRLLIFTTGVRNAAEVTARAGGHTLTVESVTESATRHGTDEVRVRVPAELRGAGPVDLFVRADGRDSNPATVTFLGVAPRPDIVINEVLADPPADDETTSVVEGDANRDGVRDTSDDEFVEFVNASGRDLNIGGYQLFSHSTTGVEDNLRHTFAPGTILPAGTAIVVFGGGNFNPKNPVFGGAQVVKASEGGLTLVNGGGTVTLRDASGKLVTNFSWGGATGLEADQNQSLTRSPDITGAYALHTTASGSNGKPYSPGTRVNGQPFTAPTIARIEVTPASASIAIGQTQQFNARAFNDAGNEVSGVIFTWESSAPAIATIDENGLATGKAQGTTQITARARGAVSAPVTLNVRFVARVLTSVEVSPSTSTIPVGGQQQFTARGLDQFGNPMDGLTFTWESTDTSVATVDQNGLATGVGIGTTTITASTGGKTGTATPNVTAPKIIINEALADPPGSDDTDLAGDANHDGERDASQDEFLELVNSSTAAVDISGWTIVTRTLDGATTTLRHTFAAGTILPAGSAIVVFGGGNENFDPFNTAFGCAQVVKASSGRLSFLNSGESIVVTDANGNLTTQLTYGSDAGLNGGANQSMTRSPDVVGDFTLHTTAEGSGGRAFSPGVRVDGTPFGNCPARLTSITIQPASQSVIIGRTTQFTAQARDQFGRPMKGVAITFVSDNTNVATVDSVTTDAATGIATATVRGRIVGTAHITARATTNGTTVSSDPATLNVTPPPPRVTRIEVTPSTATINRGGPQKFTAKAFNGTTQVTAGVVVTWTSSDQAVATVDQNGKAVGVGVGAVMITATAPDGLGGTVSDTAQLTVRVPLVINEILADVPTDDPATRAIEGDANRDGVRSSGDDEFIELFNNTNAPVDISGVLIADGTSNRYTIPAGTILAAGRALVIFGGGEPPADDPAFGGALVIRIPGTLSLNDTGDTVYVKLPVGGTEVVIASESYGEAGGVAKANNQSLTRSPDAAINTTGGALVPHNTATNADGRLFSPGTRADGTPFGSPAITRIQVTPASATVDAGVSQTFTARAFSNASGTEVEVLNVSFIWDASDPAKAEVAPKTGRATTATALSGGSTLIRARAGGKPGAGTLNINFPPISRVEVTPATATIPIGGQQQFTARAFDGSNNEIPGVTFTWTSSNPSVATVDANGLATGVAIGTTTITASAGGKSGAATLTVVARTISINELLADPPEGAAGDSNRDGVRDSSDDEFVELVNALNSSINIAGWTLRTRAIDGTTETVRHTFADGATLAAGKGVVIFGGGTINAADPAFGGAQVLTASTGRLSLTNSGLTIILRNASGNVVAQFTYGGATGLNAGKDQSLTRSPDVSGDYVLHTQAPGSDGRLFSPGTRVDGTPFGSPAITRIQVLPATATVSAGATRVYTARAFSNTTGTEIEVLNVSFIWDSSNPNVATVSPTTGKTTTATALSGGTTAIRARAGGQAGSGTLNVNFPPVERIEVTPATATIPISGQQQFTAHAFDASNNEITGLTFTWTSSDTNVATIDASGLATGVGIGTTTITASAKGKSGTATLTVVARTVTINELLADPPEGLAGDANRDGVRDSSDDEFVELVNALNSSINIAGWTLRTRSLSGTTETVRHTFDDGTTLAGGKAVVIFGGGSLNAADPAFGGSQVVKASTGRLSLTNSGLQIILRDSSGNVVTQFTYGSPSGLNGDKDQSLTRSPDITGDFALHTAAANADGRVISPGTRTDGTPFGSPPITRIQVLPATAMLNVGGTRVFTARAFSNTTGIEIEVLNVSFVWDSSDPNVATVSPATGKSTTATAHAGGSATIRARAGGQAGTATLTINFPPVSRIEVSPATATIPVGGTQQFTARAFDAGNNEIPGFTFTWTSSNTDVATVDGNGLATGVAIGTTTIKATGGGKSGAATLNVVARTISINEILADPPEGLAGDANRDGVRDSADDEFVELVNALNSSVNVSGWTIRTRSLSGTTETLRHTFDAGTTLAANSAVVVFGGGSPNQADPAFGGAQVLTASTGRLSLTNSGLTIIVRDASGNLVAQLTYGGSTGLNGDKDQSLTRSPDITGDFALHTAAANADGRLFSPGTRVDGTPFGSPAITRIEVSPATATVNVGATRVFTARAFSNTGGPEVEVPNVSFIWDSSDPTRATVSPQTGKSTTATAHAGGSAMIRARAGGQAGAGTLNINFPPVSRIEVSPATATIPVGGQQQFTARAFDGSNNEIPGFTFTWTSSNTGVAAVDANGLATGAAVGTTTIKASAGGKSGTATLTVVARTVTINEVLADPPDGLAGDANRDGVRDSSDDEFEELVNALNSSINIAGWTLRTRSLSGTTETVRHTFADGSTLAGGKAVVIFGGGTINASDPAFGGSQVVTASTGRLSLTNSGLTIIVRDASGNLVTQLTYGGSTGLNGDANQSLTRSPDVTGDFALHTTAANADGRVFSPGTRTDGTPFGSPTITRIQVTPATATVNVGGMRVYTARAFSNTGGTEVEVPNVSFIWDSSDPTRATVSPQTGQSTTATAHAGGSVTIRARAGGQDGAGTLNINFPPVSRIEVSPATATIPIDGQQQFTAHAFDASNNEIPGLTFTWTSSNTGVATVDSSGLATGAGVGTTTIKASAGGKNGTATLTVVARTVTINEVLADPPEGLAGDANRDGVRDSADDEFVELVNALNSSINIAGWTIHTRSLSGTTSTLRHTFDAGTTLAAGKAIVIFGGGSPNQADPAFGGAQVLTASTGRLSLTNSGLTIIVRDASGNLVTQLTYGSASGLDGDKDQSLTRSPDITGDFVLHTAAANAAGRVISPGTRTDGTPFGSPAITRIEVTPATATVNVGGKKLYTARAFSNTTGTEIEVLNVSFIWDSSNPSVASLTPATGKSTTATALSGGTTTIRAQAGGQAGSGTLNVNFPPVSRIEVTPVTATIPVGGTQQFTARAFDAGNNEIPGITFIWTSTNTNVATVDSNGVATGVATGVTTIKASAGGKNDTAALTVVARTVTINELLADPPDGLAGDANRDGVRDSTDDEFIELVNALNTSTDISGWTIRTRSLSGTTETVRHTFDAGTILPAGRAIVVFGGGTINAADPAFGGAQVVATSTSGLSLTNSGVRVIVRDSSGNLVAQLTYGSAASLNGDSNQSLTRSPDITGDFALHTTAPNSDGRRFSPGARVDGTPFGSPPITRIEITPASANVYPGDTQLFTARAYSNTGGPEVEVLNVSFIWDSSVTNVATVSPETGRTTTATAVAPGTTTIRARAGGQADTSTLTVNPIVASVELEPASASVPATATRTFTATARDSGGNVIPGITFTFSLRNPSPANAATITGTTATTVTVRGDNEGSVTVVASYTRPNDGVTLEDTSLLTITAPPPRVTSVEVSPDTATINRGQTQQFTVTAFDGATPVSGVTYTWTSSDTAVATVDQNGLATGVGIGTTTITATAPDGLGGTVSDTAQLTVQVPLVINEILADPPTTSAGDSNHDGTTNTDDDEFVEVVNNSNAPVDVSGVVLSDSVSNRFTFPAGTILAANQAALIFGGGSPDASDPNFGGALIFTTSSLGLNNTGDTVTLKLAVGGTDVVIATETYGSNAGNDQSLTRSPDLTGAFEHHTTATNSNNRLFSPGTRVDGTPFGSPTITRIEVTPATASVDPGDTQQFTAKAFSNTGGPEVEVPNVSFFWTSSNTTVATVAPTVGQGTTATALAAGTSTISALAGGQAGTATLTVNPVVASIELAPASASVNVGSSQIFTATARDSGGNVITGLTFSFSLRDASPANAATITGTTATTVTVRGDNEGTVTVVVNYTRPNDGVTLEDTSPLTITPAPPLVDHVEVTPSTATINRGQTQQFTATAFDSSNQPIPGATFTWTSSNTGVATIDANGLATGVGIGTTTITAETSDGQGGTVSGTATLNVQVPLVINEVLADVPPDVAGTTDIVEGDSNRDGVRSADDDEFVELLNNSNAPVDLSGVVISDSTSNRFTFPSGTTLAAGRAVVIFGGGTPPTSDPAFGGALILTTSSLGLNDGGDTVTVKLNVGGSDVQIDQVAYGGANPAPAPSDQSLTRSPDAEIGTTGGSFVAHSAATNAHNRVFSPGTRVDGTPFGSPTITRIEVTPATASVDPGDTQQFTAKAFSNTGGPEVEVPNVSFFWTSSNTPVATVAPLTGQTTTATAHASGGATITAFAGGQSGTAALTVNAPPPSLSINNVSMTEGDAGAKSFVFTIQLDAPAPAGGVKFDIETADNTATDADNDYEPNSATGVTIPATETSTTFTVMVNGDLTIESDETFFVNVTNVTGATVGEDQGVGTIQNDDSPTLSIDNVTAAEGNSGTQTYTFTVHLSQPAPAGGVSFDIATQNNTAVVDDGNPATISDNDYVGKSLPGQTIPETAQNYQFTVTVNCDTVVEPDETFFVNVTNVVGATLSDGQGLGTIQNDDTPDLVISQIYPGGGNAGATYTNDFIEIFNQGTTTIDFSVTNYSVQYAGATANFGAANTKTDITTGTIGPGQYFLIQEASGGANGVVLPTPDATGVIAMSATAGKVALVLGTTGFTGTTCPGDDGTPPLNPNNVNIVDFVGYGTTANCYEGSGPAPFSTSTAGGLDPDARSVIRKAGGCTDTNDNAADFLNPVTAPVARNTVSPTNSCVAGPAPNLTINDVTAAEGNSGSTTYTFTVHLSSPALAGGVQFDIATADDTATDADNDYEPRSLTSQTIAAGNQDYTFDVTVNGDAAFENNETFFVNVTNVSGATVADAQSVGTIQNDDSQPSFSIDDVTHMEGNSGTTSYVFNVTKTGATAVNSSVQFQTVDGTATLGDSDYQSNTGTLNFLPADTTMQITVLVNGDTTAEPDEMVTVQLFGATGATISDDTGTGTIQNDDSPPAPLVVTKTADTDDHVCDADCSLREAVFEANLHQDADTISFQIPTTDPGYNSTTGVYTITLTSAPGPISITEDLTINGLGANVLTISGNQANRIFSTPTGVAVTLDGMTMRDGAAGPAGGAISNSGAMTISNSILTNNAAAGGPTIDGGAINNAGALTIIYSTLSNNSATGAVGRGGAISNSGTLTILHSTLSGNTTHSTTTGNGSASYGGAIFNSGSNSVVNLINSTLSGNSAVGGNSTPFGGAQAFGGAIYNAAGGQGVARLTNCTLSGNFFIGGDQNAGGGIYNGGGVVSGRNTIIAQGVSTDVFGAFVSQGHNIIANTSGAVITNSNPYPGGDKFDAAASPLNLGALQNNGGTTETRALGAGSVAIDAGDDCVADAAHCGDANTSQLAFDQRGTGFPRKVDGDGNSTATVDIGAYEVQTPFPSFSIDDVTHMEGNAGTTTYTFTVHLSSPALAGGVSFDIATQDNSAKVDDGNPATISDNDYVGKSLTGQTIAEGSQDYQFTVTVNGDTVVEPNESFFVNVTNVSGATVGDGQGLGTIQNDDTPDLVISQIYPGGGNAGATYTHDFIELFNQGTTTIDFSVTNYSVQYAGATANFGAANAKTDIITGTIAPGQYFLIQEAAGAGNGVALPTPDATGVIAMSAAAGKVALVLGTTAFTGTTCPGDDGTPPFNPNNATIVDFVGYGSGTGANAPNCYEGSSFAPFSTSTAGGLDPDARSTIRTPSCTDTNNNSTDFSNPTTAPTARNKATTPAPCP